MDAPLAGRGAVVTLGPQGVHRDGGMALPSGRPAVGALQHFPLPGDPVETDDDEYVGNGQGDDGSEAEEGFADEGVDVVQLVVSHFLVLFGLVLALAAFGAGLDLLVTSQGNVEEDSAGKGSGDGQVGVLEGVYALEMSGVVDGDVPAKKKCL